MRRDVARNVSEIPSNNHGDVARYVSTKDHPCTKYDPLSPYLRSNITIKKGITNRMNLMYYSYLCRKQIKTKPAMEELFQKRFRIPSARASWHNYREGMYFITICTHQQKTHFGRIIPRPGLAENQLVLTEMGRYVEENLQQITSHYPYAEIPVFVIMPNHLHFIIIIDSADDSNGNVSTGNGCQIHMKISPQKGSLSTVIRGFKSAITKYARERGIAFAWQTRFYDRIIRNQNELNAIATYIENNPYK